MTRHTDTTFQPKAPSRTFSDSSTLTGASAENARRAPSSPSSPTEQSFFNAITSRVRSGRSRSRSRNGDCRRQRSKSPLPPPPSSTTDSTTTLTNANAMAYSVGPRSPTAAYAANGRTPTTGSTRSQDSTNMWYGRHSNSWLFNDFSVTESVKGAFRRH